MTLVREWSPERPGPGIMPDPLLRALNLQIARRIDGLLAGDFQATRLGRGTELAQVRVYEPGNDDVRDIDWSVTARTGQPHVRVHVAERVVTSWLLLDVSPSMSFGTADRTKADVAEGVALAVGHLATRRGNRLGLMTFGEDRPQIIAPAQGRAGLLRLLTLLRREPAADGSGYGALGPALKRARALLRGRTVVFLVSDLQGPKDWRAELLALGDRHDVIAIEVRDRREQELVDVGQIWMIDPETGRHLRVDTRRAELRRRFARAAASERDEVTRLVRAARADHLVLTTHGDWLGSLAAFMSTRRQRR